MRWMGGRQSDNVEDRRGMGVPLVAGGGIGTIVGGVVFVVALPIEIPLGIYFFYSIVNSGLWF